MEITYRKEKEGRARVIVNGQPTGLVVVQATNATWWNYFLNFETPESHKGSVKRDCSIVNAEPTLASKAMHQTVINLLHSELYMDATQVVGGRYRVYKGCVSCYLPWCSSWEVAEKSGYAVKVYDPADYGVVVGTQEHKYAA